MANSIANYGDLIHAIMARGFLSHHGIHGTGHWMRVRRNGLLLAEAEGANSRVIELFAVFHDSQRRNDNHDPEHGKRGAALAFEFRQQGLIDVSDAEFAELEEACCDHTNGGNAPASLNVAVCWDADRLDLGRVGITPDPSYLCTEAAKDFDMLNWAYEQSVARLTKGSVSV